jgi:hypothetical protein
MFVIIIAFWRVSVWDTKTRPSALRTRLMHFPFENWIQDTKVFYNTLHFIVRCSLLEISNQESHNRSVDAILRGPCCPNSLENKHNSWESCQVAFIIEPGLRTLSKYRSFVYLSSYVNEKPNLSILLMLHFHLTWKTVPISQYTLPGSLVLSDWNYLYFPFHFSLDLKNWTHFSVHFTWFLCVIWMNLPVKLPVQYWSAEFKHINISAKAVHYLCWEWELSSSKGSS